MTDEELKQLVASIAVAQHKNEIRIQETDRLMKETDRLMRETDQQLKEQMRETDQQLKEQMRETDRQLKEQMRETDKQIKELGKQIGGLGEKFGSFTEGMAFPSMGKILTDSFGMDAITTRYRVRKNGKTIELDVFAYTNGTENKAIIVEVKSHLREEHIQCMLQLLSEAKQFLTDHATKKFYGMLAVVDAPTLLKEQVLLQGIYYAEIHDNSFDVKVPPDFKARAF